MNKKHKKENVETKKDLMTKANQTLKFEPKAEDNFVWRGIILLILVFGLVLLYSYNAYQSYQKNLIEQEMQKAAQKIIDSENIESEIYDLEYEKVVTQKKTEKLDQETSEEFREVNSKIQNIEELAFKINEFEQRIAEFEENLADSNLQRRLNSIILSYFDFRKKLFQGGDYAVELQNLELLAKDNAEILEKIVELKLLLPDFKSDWQIKKQFKDIEPLLLARQNNDPDQGFISNLRYNLSKIFVVRNLREDAKTDLEKSISKIFFSLKNLNYQLTLQKLENIDPKYNEILKEFKILIANRVEIEKVDFDLLSKFGS